MKTRYGLFGMMVAHLMFMAVAILLMAGCSRKGPNKHIGKKRFRTDTLYTQRAAMDIYPYQPERALQILDSAVILGKLSEWQADMCLMYYASVSEEAQLPYIDYAKAISNYLLSHGMSPEQLNLLVQALTGES